MQALVTWSRNAEQLQGICCGNKMCLPAELWSFSLSDPEHKAITHYNARQQVFNDVSQKRSHTKHPSEGALFMLDFWGSTFASSRSGGQELLHEWG